MEPASRHDDQEKALALDLHNKRQLTTMSVPTPYGSGEMVCCHAAPLAYPPMRITTESDIILERPNQSDNSNAATKLSNRMSGHGLKVCVGTNDALSDVAHNRANPHQTPSWGQTCEPPQCVRHDWRSPNAVKDTRNMPDIGNTLKHTNQWSDAPKGTTLLDLIDIMMGRKTC